MAFWLLALSLAIAVLDPAQVHGGWVLVAVHNGDQVSHDPRMSASLELYADGAFDLRADTVQEVRLGGPRGETTRAGV